MAELSIIIPYVGEWPQIMFTVASIHEELRDRCDYEIIVVDNYIEGTVPHTNTIEKSRESMDASAKGQPWLKSLEYKEKLSHWQAKNLAVQQSTGKFLWFCDAHCIIARDALYDMLRYYRDSYQFLDGTLHLPLTYKILEWRKTGYKLVYGPERGIVHYTLTRYKPSQEIYRVPCMSTCGMMMTRELYDLLGGWPVELGIYGGGENFINFTLAVLGKSINIYPGQPLRHHGDKRDYSWNYNDYHRNRMIATYMFGGPDWLYKYASCTKGDPKLLRSIADKVHYSCTDHRRHIQKYQVTDIKTWAEKEILL